MLIVVLLLIAAFLIGLTLFVIGLRGRRIDDHPLCRKCKYDLVGTEKLPTNCPECGTILNKKRATRIGNRKRRRALLVVGFLIFASSLTTSGFLSWAQAKNFDWYPYKPLWVLQSEIEKDPGIKGAKKATAEIFKRLENDNLSDRQINNVVSNALELQADSNANWNYFWGDFLEEAWLKGKVEDDTLKKYFVCIFDEGNKFEIRSKVRHNDWTLYRFAHFPKRTGSGKRFQAMIEYGPIKLDGKTIKETGSIGTAITGGPGGMGAGSNLEFPDKLGKYTLTTSQQIWIYQIEKYLVTKNIDLAYKERWNLLKSLTICDWWQDFTKQIEVVDEDTPVLDQIKDDSMATEIHKQILTLHCSVFVRSGRKNPNCLIMLGELPQAVSLDVYWRIGDKQWLITTVIADSTGLNRDFYRPKFLLDQDFPISAKTVDVVLRSNPKYAEEHTRIDRVWVGEDIVIKNQPLYVKIIDD